MLLRTRRKAGFTLIELLVVMGIIAILLALLLPSVQRSRVRRDQTENYHRMQKVATALAGLKDSNNGLNLAYIPSGGFWLRSAYSQTDPEYYILKKAWPNLDMTNTGLVPAGGQPVQLDGNQTLTFFLTGGAVTGHTGFSTNPRYPFQTGGARKGPYLEHNSAYIVAAPNGHSWLVDPFGTPYAYFAAVDGRTGAYTGQTFTAPGAGTTSPVMRGTKFIKEDSFQLISAGYDKVFGPGGALPASGSPGGMDDQGHFQESILGSN